jgi:hypothetical protein
MKHNKALVSFIVSVSLVGLLFAAFYGTSWGSPLTGSTPVVPQPGESWVAAAATTGTDDAAGVVESRSTVKLKNTDVQVTAYRRQGEIRRLYGESFSSGLSPQESAESFLEWNAAALGVERSDLSDLSLQPLMYQKESESYKFTAVNYLQKRGGIPVFGSRLILLVRNESNYPLVLASSGLHSLGEFDPAQESPRIGPQEAIASASKLTPGLKNFNSPELVIWAGVDDIKASPVMAYSFVGDNYPATGDDQKPERYRYVVDASNGNILYIENLIIFVDVTGQVEGKATQGKAADYCEEELAEGMPWARVAIGSTQVYGDSLGNFVIPNSGSSQVVVTSGLLGHWFSVANQAGSNEVLYDTIIPPGPADFMHNNANTDEYVRAQTNGYLQANVVRDFTLKYNPSYPGLQQNQFPVKVNDNTLYCPGNAWYDGSSITFCRAASGYPNTAWSTIIHHEYGHHLVAMAGSGQQEYGEGMGDVMGSLITDNAGTGYGFTGSCTTPLRNADNTMQYPCSGEIHYCGQLLSGCVWSTRNALYVTYPGTYLDIISDLAVNAMLLHSGGGIDPSITIDYLTLDDDNGNIYDGTPHYAEIAVGFGAHNMDAPELSLLAYSFPNGLPELILPSGGTIVRVEVTGVIAQPQPGTGKLYFNDGSGWDTIAMTEVQPNIYDAVFPGTDCGIQVSYYFKTQTTDGRYQSYPSTAPSTVLNAVAATGEQIFFTDDFNTDKSWTVQNGTGLTTGAWQRGIPAGGGSRCDPPTDYDGSGYCYITDNRVGDYDIDGGITWLISPNIDLSQVTDALVHYAVWYKNDCGADPNNDLFYVYVSSNGGTNWTTAQTIGPGSLSDWTEYSFMVSDFVTPSSRVKVRFEASDLNSGSVVEAGVDAFDIKIYECGPALGDVNADGLIDVADVIYIINYVFKGGPDPVCSPIVICSDVNSDGEVSISDVVYLINYLYHTGPPPGK